MFTSQHRTLLSPVDSSCFDFLLLQLFSFSTPKKSGKQSLGVLVLLVSNVRLLRVSEHGYHGYRAATSPVLFKQSGDV